MNVLIVHAHPEPQSFCSALKDAAVASLTGQGHTVEVSDLYAMNFNPVASATDFASRQQPDYLVYALEQRHAQAAATLAPDIQAEITKVQAADLLIFSFPLFWMLMPAMLKGWIDRVFVSGLFYGGKRVYDQGGMRGKKALMSLTLGGRDYMFGPGALHGSWSARPACCAICCKVRWVMSAWKCLNLSLLTMFPMSARRSGRACSGNGKPC